MSAPSGQLILRRSLRRSLAVVLPDPTETQLLRCLLHSGDDGRRAWQAWCGLVGDPKSAFKGERLGQKSLLPLLHAAVERNALPLDAGVASWLRATYFREQMRGNAYRRVLDTTLSGLGVVGTLPLVLKGCALSDTVYPDRATRHSHGIELLVRDDDFGTVAARLPGLGFSAVRRHHATQRSSTTLSWQHASGLPLEMRARPFDIPHYAASHEAVWQRARPLPGHAALQAASEDALLHVCGNASMSGSRVSLRWACDAYFLLQAHVEFDWPLLLRSVEDARLGLPLSGILRYLREALHAPIPASVITRLDALADATDDTGHEVATMGALVASHARMRRIIANDPDWRSAGLLARRLLVPSAACVREMGWVGRDQSLLAFYLRRPSQYLGARVARLLSRRPRIAWSRVPGWQ